jgi:hypothetical protein
MIGGQCLPAAETLIAAVESCGPSLITIEKGSDHYQYVSFPVDWKPGAPPPLEIVKCIRAKVGFRFSAEIGPALSPGVNPMGDSKPFISLRSDQADGS